MNWLASDEEYTQLIQSWWKKNKHLTIITLILMVCISTGSEYYRNHQKQQKRNISQAFITFVQKYTKNEQLIDYDEMTKEAHQFNQTTYRPLAHFMLAKQAITYHNFYQAEKQLTSVIQQEKQPLMQEVARLRLARIFIHQQQYQSAQKQLSAITHKPLTVWAKYYQGTIYQQQQQPQKAHLAYQQVLDQLPDHMISDEMKTLITLKYNMTKPITHKKKDPSFYYANKT